MSRIYEVVKVGNPENVQCRKFERLDATNWNKLYRVFLASQEFAPNISLQNQKEGSSPQIGALPAGRLLVISVIVI